MSHGCGTEFIIVGEEEAQKSTIGGRSEPRPGHGGPWHVWRHTLAATCRPPPVLRHPTLPCLPDAPPLPGDFQAEQLLPELRLGTRLPHSWQLASPGCTLSGTRLRWMNHQCSFGGKCQQTQPRAAKAKYEFIGSGGREFKDRTSNVALPIHGQGSERL